MPTADRQRAFARQWLSKARTDLALASVILEKGPEMEPWAAAFHAQQAAEKAIKALLIASFIEPPRTHDLEALWELLRPEPDLGVSAEVLARISSYSSDSRYVQELAHAQEPTWEEAEAAFVVAGTILRTAIEQITGR